MAGGQQLAEDNVRKFATWVAARTDDDFRSMTLRGVLSRTDIATECGFAKSVLSQNPRIRDSLKELEAGLRDRGVLPKPVLEGQEKPLEPRTRQGEGVRGAREAERLKRLEQENASLRAELAEVKLALRRYAALQDALGETGRLPR